MRRKTKHWKSGGNFKIQQEKRLVRNRKTFLIPQRGAQKLVKNLDSVWKRNGK